MMTSMVWVRPILSSASLHSVSSVTSCCCVTGHCSGAWQVVHSTGAMLQSHCSYLPDGDVCPELLNHSVL
jgi:hypothetical protein